MSRYSNEKIKIIDQTIISYMMKLPKHQHTWKNLAKLTGYSPNFIGQRIQKIEKARAKRFINETIETHLSKYQDKIEMLNAEMQKIISDPKSSKKDIISAARVLAFNENQLFEKMFDAGIFERQLGRLEQDHKFGLAAESFRFFIMEYRKVRDEQSTNDKPEQKQLPAGDTTGGENNTTAG